MSEQVDTTISGDQRLPSLLGQSQSHFCMVCRQGRLYQGHNHHLFIFVGLQVEFGLLSG